MYNMGSSSWKTAEDIRRDLYEYSDLEIPRDNFVPAPPKSITEYRARTSTQNRGLFDGHKDLTGVFISGRGKLQPNRIIRPGGPVNVVPEDDSRIWKKIREVSGLGYRNEMIEKAFSRNKEYEEDTDDEEKYSIIMPDLKLQALDSGKSSTINSPIRLSPVTIITNSDRTSATDTKFCRFDYNSSAESDNSHKLKM